MENTILLALVSFLSVIIAVHGDKVNCFSCRLDIIDGRKDGFKNCESGDDMIENAYGKTKRCSKGCYKKQFLLKVTEAGDSYEVERHVRGCDETGNRDKCKDENDSYEAEDLYDMVVPDSGSGDGDIEISIKWLNECFCEGDRCNSAPSGSYSSNAIIITTLAVLCWHLLYLSHRIFVT